MAPAEITPGNYAEILQFVAISLMPFLQDGGEPAIPLVAWCAAYNAALVAYEYYQRVQVADCQKNRLLLDRLGERGIERLDQHEDALRVAAAIMPHAAFLEDVRRRLQVPVMHSGTTEPPTGASKP